MKIILIGDPHIKVRGALVRGVASAERLDLCVSRINELVPDADLCVVMGDNVDIASRLAYEALLECLRPLKMPVRFLVGNHDERIPFQKAAPAIPCDENGFVQSAIETDDSVLLFLDTLKEGSEAGEYCAERLTWLKQKLRDAGDRHVYLFMHHPPFQIGFFIDHDRLENSEEFTHVLNDTSNIRHIFVGHTHRAASGNWNGLTWSTLHGIAYQSDFELLPAKPNYRSGPAQIGILLIDKGNSVLHYQDILEPYPLIAYSGRSERLPMPAGLVS